MNARSTRKLSSARLRSSSAAGAPSGTVCSTPRSRTAPAKNPAAIAAQSRARRPLRGQQALQTACIPTAPTSRKNSVCICAGGIGSADRSARFTRKQTRIATALGSARRSALGRNRPEILRPSGAKDSRNEGNPSMTRSIHVTWMGTSGNGRLHRMQTTDSSTE